MMILVSSLTAGPALSQTILRLAGDKLEEDRLAAPNISDGSGSLIVGIDLAGAEVTPELDVIANLPKSWVDRAVCLSVVTADGLYVARNTYSIAVNAGGFAQFPFESDYAEYLASLAADDIAVLVSEGTCKDEVPTVFALSGWRLRPQDAPREVRIRVKSFQAQEVLLYPSADADEPVSCLPVVDRDLTVFDAECPWVPEADASGRQLLAIYRVREGEFDDGIEFSVDLGGDP